MQKIGKEVKIGLAVIGVLLTTFGYVLVKRLTRPSEANAATVADTSQSGDSTRAAGSASESSDRPTMLSSSSPSRPASVPVEAKSSRFGDDSARRRAADGSGSDPAAGASDSFMPAQATGGFAEGHPTGPPTHDDRVAAAGYGAASGAPGGYGAAPTPGQTTYAPANPTLGDGQAATPNTGYGGARPAPADASDHRRDRSADKAGSATAVNPFQNRGAMAADNSSAASALPAQAAAPRQLDPSTDTATAAAVRTSDQHGYDAPVSPPEVSDAGNAAHGPMPSERRAADRGTIAGNGAAGGYSYGGSNPASTKVSPNSGGASDAGIVGNIVLDPNHNGLGAPVYSPSASAQYPPQRNVEPAAAPQMLALDGSARRAGQYVVQPNDNYWTISEKVYGTGAYFKAIFEYNRNRHPQADRLQVGEALDTPDATVLQRTYPDLCPKVTRTASTGRVVPASARMQSGTRVYAVEEGDTLFEIARRELGRPSRWGEIYQLNRDTIGSDFDYLRPGTELLLPSDGGAAGSQATPIARDPSDTMLR